jgi:hypothetical protein
MDQLGERVFTEAGLVAALLFFALGAVITYFRSELSRERAERQQAQETLLTLLRQTLDANNNLASTISLLRERLPK